MNLPHSLRLSAKGSPHCTEVNRSAPVVGTMMAVLATLAASAAISTAEAQVRLGEQQTALGVQAASAAHPTRAFWQDVRGVLPAASPRGAAQGVRPSRFRATRLDRVSLTGLTAFAPMERSDAARLTPLVLSLPDPSGGFQRFTVVESPVMEPALAAKHPNIRTYAGRGIDDPTASLRMDITPLGFHASIRSQRGSWYIDPFYNVDDSVYVSYFTRDLPNPRPSLTEGLLGQPQLSLQRGRYHAANSVEVRGVGFAPGTQVTFTVRNLETDASPRQTHFAVANEDGTVLATFTADPYRNVGSYEVMATDGIVSSTATYQVVSEVTSLNAAVGAGLRVYRLALLTDPSYATYFGGSANVTAAKVTLVNRVTQIYEDETSIRLVLIANNDTLNLDNAAQMTGTNGPCGGSACYTAAQAGTCSSSTLSRTRQVIGLLVGASSYDVGHIALGVDGGGIASLGVVGGNNKAQGCTGLPTPVGDFFAVDYVAHEVGHQFAGNHTFNGTVGSCSRDNRSAANSVEPGSGSSIMAYAGICGSDDLQPHTDPYWSQRTFDEIVAYTSAAETSISEVQMAVLTGFDGVDQFQLRFNGVNSVPIVRGTNFTTAGIKAAIEGIAGWPAGGTVSISGLGDTAFTVTFGGTLAGTDAGQLHLVNCAGCSGFVGEIAKGGLTARGGAVSATGNTAPVVNVFPSYTIPVRTPFALTGSATDADGDTITYMWEQNDRGAASGTGLISNTKTDGPLFRQFGTRAVVSPSDSLLYNSPGQNHVTTDPTRVFPDMAQILANNTNAEAGTCPTASNPPTATQIDCFSEFLPTAGYLGVAGVNASPASLNFKLTARDGRGGVNSATTQLILAPGAGPFLVTSPNTAVTLDGTSTQTVTWAVAATNVAPVSAANVNISLSVDGGSTWPYTLAASVPNNGSRAVVLPNVGTTTARIKVAAVGNVFFDVSNADFTIRLTGDVNNDGTVDCRDLAIVQFSIKRPSRADPRADVVVDGVVDIWDWVYVSERLAPGTSCW